MVRRDSLLRSAAHGPLPGLLLALTIVTGAIDAVSILRLGRVFVANMTGNVVFAGFAAVGAPGFALGSSLVALAGFLVGAAFGGWLATRFHADRAALLLAACVVEVALSAAALVIAASVVRNGEWRKPPMRRRLAAVVAMVGGAVVGAELVLHRGATADLVLVTAILALVMVGTAITRAHDRGDWRRPPA